MSLPLYSVSRVDFVSYRDYGPRGMRDTLVSLSSQVNALRLLFRDGFRGRFSSRLSVVRSVTNQPMLMRALGPHGSVAPQLLSADYPI